ncbi:MAG: hypothetical protein V3S11_04555 [Elusimicrobiota bacterium]
MVHQSGEDTRPCDAAPGRLSYDHAGRKRRPLAGTHRNPVFDHDGGADFLSNPSDPAGISLFTEGFRRSLNKPGATAAIVTSRLAHRVLTECSAVGGVTRSPALVGRVAKANPQVLLLMADPRLINALIKNPSAMRVLTDTNSSSRK